MIIKLQFFLNHNTRRLINNNVKFRETLIGGNLKESNNANRSQNKKSNVQ